MKDGFWIALFGALLSIIDYATEIEFSREKAEHANAPIESCIRYPTLRKKQCMHEETDNRLHMETNMMKYAGLEESHFPSHLGLAIG